MNKKTLEKIEEFVTEEMEKCPDSLHDFSHLERVRKNVLKIARALNLENKIDLNLLQAAALLHDLHYAYHPPTIAWMFMEGRLVRPYLHPVFDKFDLSQSEREILYEAIVFHAHSFPARRLNGKRSVYTKILQDADTYDFFSKERLEKLKTARTTFPIYWVLWKLGRKFYILGRKHIRVFLNYPELSILIRLRW